MAAADGDRDFGAKLMARRIEILFTKRNVSGVATLLDEEAPSPLTSNIRRVNATLLDEEAPLTCDAVWNALPLEGDAYHARWAGREVYTLAPPLGSDPGKENATILPIAGDLLYFEIPAASIDIPPERRTGQPFVDIALFYGRNNFLLGPEGYMPGNLFATVTENLEGLAAACESIWREGFAGERIVIRRIERNEDR